MWRALPTRFTRSARYAAVVTRGPRMKQKRPYGPKPRQRLAPKPLGSARDMTAVSHEGLPLSCFSAMSRIVRPLRSVGSECFALSRSLGAHVKLRQKSSGGEEGEKKKGGVLVATADCGQFSASPHQRRRATAVRRDSCALLLTNRHWKTLGRATICHHGGNEALQERPDRINRAQCDIVCACVLAWPDEQTGHDSLAWTHTYVRPRMQNRTTCPPHDIRHPGTPLPTPPDPHTTLHHVRIRTQQVQLPPPPPQHMP